MPVKVKHVNHLPEWFSLKNYKHVSGFEILEWRNELMARAIILRSLKVPKFDFLVDLSLIDFVSSDVVAACINHSRGVVTGRFSPLEISEKSPLGPAKMKDLRFQAYLDRAAVESGAASQVLIDRWGRVRPVLYLQKDFMTAMDLCISVEHEEGVGFPYLLKVDVGAPDSVLVEAFSDWLSCVRGFRDSGSVEVVKSSNTGSTMYRHWHNLGILPYLDLIIWEAEGGFKISSEVMAEAVVPYKSAGCRFISQETAPTARRLMAGLESVEITYFYEQQNSRQGSSNN